MAGQLSKKNTGTPLHADTNGMLQSFPSPGDLNPIDEPGIQRAYPGGPLLPLCPGPRGRYNGLAGTLPWTVVEPITAFITAMLGVAVVASALLYRLLKGRRYEMTKPALRNLALQESDALIALVDERQASRPRNDTVVEYHDLPSRRVTLHDEETRRLYVGDYLPRVRNLRNQFAQRGIRDGTLDRYYESAENEADLRTVATVLPQMAKRL